MQNDTGTEAPSVLIVDDDEFFHSVLTEMLCLLGVNESDIHTATNGLEALRKLKSLPRPPQYLISDVFMPDMDGMEFLSKLSERGYCGKVVMVSGVDAEMLDLSRTIAADNGLTLAGAFVKPISLAQLSGAMGLAQVNPA
jgi:CheY-like chemotaxis protein